MFCSQCAGALLPEDVACRKCGSRVTSIEQPASDRFAATIADTQKVSREIVRDPTRSLGVMYSQLGPDRAFVVGIVFVALFAVAVAIMARGVVSSALFGLTPTWLPLLAGAVAFPVGIAAIYSVVRNATKRGGSFSADLFIAAISVLPLALACASVGVLSIKNIEVLVVGGFVGFCMTVMLLFAGAARISGFSERAALLVVPLSMLLAAWGSKVITAALL